MPETSLYVFSVQAQGFEGFPQGPWASDYWNQSDLLFNLKRFREYPLWHSGLIIWLVSVIPGPSQWVKDLCCYGCGLSCSSGSDSVPGLGASLCRRYGGKREENKNKNKMPSVVIASQRAFNPSGKGISYCFPSVSSAVPGSREAFKAITYRDQLLFSLLVSGFSSRKWEE